MAGYLQQVLNIMGQNGGAHSAVDPRRQLWNNLGARLSDASAQNKEWQDIASGNWQPATNVGGGGVGGTLSDVLSGAGNIAGRGMDILSRLGYAVRAPIVEGIKEEGSSQRNLDVGKLLAASWHGLEGTDKASTSDIEDALGWHATQMKGGGVGGEFNNLLRGFVGFAGDVGLDPITYIPGGLAVDAARVGAKAGFEAAGKTLPKVLEKGGLLDKFRVKNSAEVAADKTAEQIKSAPDAVTAAKQSLDQTGVAKVNSDISDKVINDYNGKPETRTTYPFDVAEPASELSNVARLTSTMPTTRLGLSPEARKTGREMLPAEARLATYQTQANDLLKPIEAPKYLEEPKVEPFQVATSRQGKPVEQEVSKTRTIPASPFATPEAAVKDTLENTIHPNSYVNGKFKLLNSEGKPFAKDVNTGGAATVAKIKTQGLTPKDMLDYGTGAKEVPAHLKDAHIVTKAGNTMPLPKFVKMMQSKARTTAALAGKTKVEKYTEKELVTPTIEGTRKIRSNLEKAAWIAQHQHLAPGDAEKLAGAGMKSYTEFEKALEEVRTSTLTHQYGSLEELEKALADGTAPKEVQDAVKEQMGRKKLGTLRKNLEEAQKTVDAKKETQAAQNARVMERHQAALDQSLEESRNNFKQKFGMPNVEGHPDLMRRVGDKIDKELTNNTVPTDATSLVEPHIQDAAAVAPHRTDTRETLQQWQADVLKDELKESNIRQFQIDRTHPNLTGRGANTPATAPYTTKPGEYVRWKYGFNSRSQMELVQNIVNKASEQLKNIPEAERADTMYNTVMPMLHAADMTLKENGVTRILGTGAHGQGIPMSMHDILSSLDPEFAKKFFFDIVKSPPGKTFKVSNNMLPTQVMDIAEQMIHLGLGNIDRNTARSEIKKLLAGPAGTSNKTSLLGERLGRPVKGGMSAEQRLEAGTDEVMAGFENALPKIMDTLENNIKDSVMAETHIAAKLSQGAIDKFDAAMKDPTFPPGAKIKEALDSYKLVDEEAHLANIDKYHQGVQMAQSAMAAHVATEMPMGSVNAVDRLVNDIKRAANKNEAVAADQKFYRSASERGAASIEEDGGNVHDLGRNADVSTKMHYAMKFVPHLGNEDLHPLLLREQSIAQTYIKQQTRVLSKVFKNFTSKQIEDGWNAVRDWHPGMETTPVMDALLAAAKDTIDATDGGYGWFTRNVKDVNALMEDYKMMGVPDHIKLDPNDLENSFRQWEPGEKGILDTLSRINAAHTHAMAKANMGAELSEQWGSKIAQPGYVKIINSGKERNSELIKYINTDLYYPEDIAKQMHILDTTLEAVKKGDKSSSPTARNLLKNLDIATQMWKAGVTIYRPGHHVRNAIGDIWLATMDGVRPGHYKRAGQVIGTRQGQYPDFNGLRAATQLGSAEKLPNTVLTLKFGNEVRHFSPDQVYRMMDTAGGLPSFDVIEDVSLKQPNRLDPKTGAGVLGKLQNIHLPGPLEGKAHKLATNVSEGREHYIRIAHFLHAMEDQKLVGKSFDEAIKKATFDSVQRVRRWHPDGSDLTQFERRYMRRLIPFYSWTRKAIPLVLETAVQKPGMAMLYPKAMYNWAESQGINLNGYGDAFPTDQIFPSWISDSVQGPTWGAAGSYAGIKPGVPIMDVADDYLANPKQTWQTIIGQTHPFLRVPIEMMTQKKLRTGGPISDMSDYIDQQIPGGSYLDALAGNRSLSTGFIQPNAVAPSNVGYENPSVPKFPVGGSAILNWLTGLGFTDYSKPSYEKFAQLEQKRAGG